MSTINQELAVIPEQAITPKTPMDLMQQAITQGLSVEQLQVIQQMYYAQQDRDAKRAYDVAMLEFKKNPPAILKTRPVFYKEGPGAKPAFYYAPLEEVCPLVVGALNAHGLTHKWRTDPAVNAGWIRVTCILTHELGHKEENSLEAPPDPSGGKNGIQAVISTTHYLERVTLLSACGLSASGLDNDGGTPKAKLDNLAEHLEFIANSRNRDELKRMFFNGLTAAKKVGDLDAEHKLSEAKNKKYRELPQ